MELVGEHVWTRVWNIGCLESERADPGSCVTGDFGRESLLFVRNGGGQVRGFYNVCQQRGNRLVQS